MMSIRVMRWVMRFVGVMREIARLGYALILVMRCDCITLAVMNSTINKGQYR